MFQFRAGRNVSLFDCTRAFFLLFLLRLPCSYFQRFFDCLMNNVSTCTPLTPLISLTKIYTEKPPTMSSILNDLLRGGGGGICSSTQRPFLSYERNINGKYCWRIMKNPSTSMCISWIKWKLGVPLFETHCIHRDYYDLPKCFREALITC